MKKLLFLLMCVAVSIGANAQLKGLKISSCNASSEETAKEKSPAANAIDGDISTYWHSNWSSGTTFPVRFQINFLEDTQVDVVRYIPRQDQPNGAWGTVRVEYRSSETGSTYVPLATFNLGQKHSSYDFEIGKVCRFIRFYIENGHGNFATAAEVEAYAFDNTKKEAFESCFEDNLYTVLKPGVTSSEGIEDPDVKALVDNILADAEGYKKFRVAEYEPYRTLSSLQNELKTKNQYNQWENPTGIYLKKGESCYVVFDGADSESVGLKIKNWVQNEDGSSYGLVRGLNKITATTEGNVFVDYYTDNYKTAANAKLHFINAPVRGYWDQQTMTNEDWKQMLSKLPNDNSIIIVRSEHAQVAYPLSAWKTYCPTNVDSLMTMYQQVQWAERDIMGLNKFGRQCKNRMLFYATNYGFMAAGALGSYCNVSSLGGIMKPDSKSFDFWGVGHEWGHNNQIEPGFHWSGLGETSNNVYASWAQLHFTGTRNSLRLEDEYSGIDEYSGMRGGRMQTYFEEGLRKGVQWQLQDGPDYHGATPDTKTVAGYDYDGKFTGNVTTTSRNYDHFVKLVPFWQLNIWGTLAGKCPDIIPMVIEGIRTTPDYKSTYNTNGKQQINWMKLACDSAKINLLPFFEKAGMLKPINAYIEDYGAGWIKINQTMIDNLKKHVASKGYPDYTEEINYINAHNFHIYRDNLKLQVPASLGTGCTASGNFVKVSHSSVKNAVAFETYNANDEIVRITMYGLGSNDAHDFTMVLYPAAEDEGEAAAYIMAVGYDGTRKKIYAKNNITVGLAANKYYTLTSVGQGSALSCGTNTSIDQKGKITWDLKRASLSVSPNFLWYVEKRDGKTYLYNPQSGSYFTGTSSAKTTELCDKASAPHFEIACVDENNSTYTFKMGGSDQYINAYNSTETGMWSGGSGDKNNIWTVAEVTTASISITSSGYYMGCYPFAVELPEGLEACVVGESVKLNYQGTDYQYIILDKLEGNVVPARLPVVLVGAPGTKYTVKLLPSDNTSITQPNILKGTTLKLTGITSGTSLYTVNKTEDAGSNGTVKFSTNNYIPANRAYLLTSDVNGATQIYLQTRDFMTGIDEVTKDSDKADVFYEVNGVRAAKLQKGHIYVTSDGKRILVQ